MQLVNADVPERDLWTVVLGSAAVSQQLATVVAAVSVPVHLRLRLMTGQTLLLLNVLMLLIGRRSWPCRWAGVCIWPGEGLYVRTGAALLLSGFGSIFRAEQLQGCRFGSELTKKRLKLYLCCCCAVSCRLCCLWGAGQACPWRLAGEHCCCACCYWIQPFLGPASWRDLSCTVVTNAFWAVHHGMHVVPHMQSPSRACERHMCVR